MSNLLGARRPQQRYFAVETKAQKQGLSWPRGRAKTPRGSEQQFEKVETTSTPCRGHRSRSSRADPPRDATLPSPCWLGLGSSSQPHLR